MKVRFLKNTMNAGRIFNAGEEANIDSALAQTVIDQELAEAVDAKSRPTKADRKAALSQLNAKTDAELRQIIETAGQALPAETTREAMITILMDHWDHANE
jgi:hypothetical protein